MVGQMFGEAVTALCFTLVSGKAPTVWIVLGASTAWGPLWSRSLAAPPQADEVVGVIHDETAESWTDPSYS